MTEHRIPAVDRAIQVLNFLARSDEPLGLREIAKGLDVPRSTVYRLINSLEAGQLVSKSGEQSYALGSGIKRLAQALPQGFDLVALARPMVEALSARLQLAVKLSVLDDGSALVVLSAVAPTAYTISTQVGRRFPLHAGAASKVLAAYMENQSASMSSLLAQKLERHTELTITDKTRLKSELLAIRNAGYAHDKGEYFKGIEAIAAPVFGPDDQCVAALSVPFLKDETQEKRDFIRQEVIDAARDISLELGARLSGAGPKKR